MQTLKTIRILSFLRNITTFTTLAVAVVIEWRSSLVYIIYIYVLVGYTEYSSEVPDAQNMEAIP